MRDIGKVAAGGAVRRTQGAGRAAAGGGGFALPEAGEAAPASAAAATMPVGLGLLAIQEGGERQARDQAARRRAESILKELQELQRELLGNAADPNRLERLAALGIGEAGTDPALREVVEAIVLRARVEMVRRGRNALVSTP